MNIAERDRFHVEAAMKQREFEKRSERMHVFICSCCLLAGVPACSLIFVLGWWADPYLKSYREWVDQTPDQIPFALLVAAAFLFLMVMLVTLAPLYWLDRRFGLRCSGCGCSLTLSSSFADFAAKDIRSRTESRGRRVAEG